MTASTGLTLEDIQSRISQSERDLALLREQRKARLKHLSQLQQQHEALQNQLRQLESEISALRGAPPAPPPEVPAAAELPTPSAPPAGPEPAAVVTPTPQPAPPAPPTIGEAILDLLRQPAGAVLTLRELADRLIAQNFPTRSKDFYGVVKSQVRKLHESKLVQPAPDGKGWCLADAAAKSAPAKPASAAKALPTTLKDAIRVVLKGRKRPLFASDLAALLLERGFQSTSKDFTGLVQSALGKMDDVERAPEGGYVLVNKG